MKKKIKDFLLIKLLNKKEIKGIAVKLYRHINKLNNIYLIDIGAHNGDFTKSLERICGLQGAILIEPIPDKAKYLKEAFQNSKYIIEESIISNSNEIRDFHVNEFKETSSILKINNNMEEMKHISEGIQNGKTIQCKSIRLDDLTEEKNVNHKIDLIKIDVQGSELQVLESAINTLESTKMIWIEISFKKLYEGSSNFEEIYNFLNTKNFFLVELQEGFRSAKQELLQADALFLNHKYY